MQAPSALMSYRQIIETRQRGLSELEVTALLNQLLVEIAKSHAIGQAHGDLSLESLWRDVSGELYMNPPLGLVGNPRTDVAAIARIAIELLSAQPYTPSWRSYCSIHPALGELLEQAQSNAATPAHASQFLQELYRIYNPPAQELTEATYAPTTGWRLGLILQAGKNLAQRILQSAVILTILSIAGWIVYEHFSGLMFEKWPPSNSSPPPPQPITPIAPPPSEKPTENKSSEKNMREKTKGETKPRAIVIPTQDAEQNENAL